MGQTAQSSLFQLTLDGNAGVAGSILHGRIGVKVNCDDLYARSVQIRLLGEELINENFKYCIIESDWKTIRVIQERHIARGSYDFPFDIELPSHLPSSVHTSKITGKTSSYTCKIQYFLEIRVNQESFQGKDKGACLPLIIFNPLTALSSEPSEHLNPPQTHNVLLDTGNLIGSISLGLNSNVPTLKRGERASLRYFIQNKSSALIQSVNLSLIETIHFLVDNNQMTASKAIYSTTIDDNDINKMSNAEPLTYQSIEMEELRSSSTHTITRGISLKVPQDCNLTTNGHLIQIHHIFKLKVKLDGVNKPFEEILKVLITSSEMSANTITSSSAIAEVVSVTAPLPDTSIKDSERCSEGKKPPSMLIMEVDSPRQPSKRKGYYTF